MICVGLCSVFLISGASAERIDDIRAWYAKIQESKALSEKKTEFATEDEMLTGTRTVRQYAGKMTAMTVEWGAGDHGSSVEHYYFKDGELFFAFIQNYSWTFVEGGTPEQPATQDSVTENRYYFDGETCIRALTRSASVKDASELEKKIAKVEQKTVEPDANALSAPARAVNLLGAASAEAICAVLEERVE
jgi:hypothetical protein